VRVFISHSHVDDPFVDKLVGRLTERQIETFVDHRHISAGEHWPSKVQNALKSCEKLIAVLSDYSVTSQNCMDEWDYFLDHRGDVPREIIPVRLSGTEAYFRLASFHYVDFRQEVESAFRQLIGRITDTEIDAPSVPPSTPNPDGPLHSALREYYPLARRPEKAIGIATGNIAEIAGADVLVNSENHRLAMDVASVDPQKSRRTISAAIHSFSARWNDRGELVEDLIEHELKRALQTRKLIVPVPLGTVIDTSAGSLENIGVRRILHAVSVSGIRDERSNPRAGTPVQLSRCVANTLAHVDQLNRAMFEASPLKRIVLPIFGAGSGKASFADVAPTLIARAIDYLEYEATQIEKVYFLAYRQKSLEALENWLSTSPDLTGVIVE
jgi:O-acetyl-ADP-ribose deacetylase (regulator of RNase III)